VEYPRINSMIRRAVGGISLCTLCVPVVAAAGDKSQTEPSRGQAQVQITYARDVQPILKQHCLKCHGPTKQESGLRVDRRAQLLRGGESGQPAVVSGNSQRSLLLQLISHTDPDQRMPPSGSPLKPDQIARIRVWIDQGAVMPETPGSDAAADTTDHWSFQPIERPEIPHLQTETIRNPIDAFIQSRLAESGLKPSAAADRLTLIRRLHLDLHGLPVTPEERDRFLQDGSPTAYERLVESALASPHYGERWARHWLDVVRFAESNGFETNRERPNAFHYRDYVINSLNSDRPYDQFVTDQLAGDAWGQIAATGFLVAGPYDLVKSPDINLTLMQRQDELADIINTTGTAFLGLTIGCARCHGHKFDPIPQRDYYALQAVFAGVQHGERPLNPVAAEQLAQRRQQIEHKIDELQQRLAKLGVPLPINVRQNLDRFAPVVARSVRFRVLKTNGSEPCLDELEIYCTSRHGKVRNIALASLGVVASSSSNLPGHKIHQLAHVHDGLYGNAHSWISNEHGRGWVALQLPQPMEIDRVAWGRDREGRYQDRLAVEYVIEVATEPGGWKTVSSHKLRTIARVGDNPQLRQRIADLQADQADWRRRLKQLTQSSQAMVYAGRFSQPGPTHRLYRGDPLSKRERVQPGGLSLLGSNPLAFDAAEQQRRRHLAGVITAQDNPLTPRVIVNRLWQYHFGTGIVSTASDFGTNGTAPSHPRLLDWLASELVECGWSLKHIQRLILLSHTYRQSNQPQAAGLRIDADCRSLWRFPPRRLEAEAIRDSMLHVSGVLRLELGGRGFNPFRVVMETVHHYFPKESFGRDDWRRMIYMTKFRQEQDAVFGVFDCPDGNQTIASRSRSTTPLQALNLLNSKFVVAQSELFAKRLQHEVSSKTDQARRGFALCFGRPPDPAELRSALKLIEQHGLPALCRALLNANEFLFIP